MFILYDILFLIFAVCYLPYVIIKRKWHADFGMRFGRFSENLKIRLAQKPNIWIHAVSVGEVMAMKGLVQRIGSVYPNHQIVLSTVTTTGQRLAREQFPHAVVMYAPLDFSVCVRRYCRVIRPVIYVAAETEIWPNIFYALSRRNIPVIQVNGRISDKSFSNYLRFRWLLKIILSYVDCFCMQTPQDAQRICRIGAMSDRVVVAGNMKFDEADYHQVRTYPSLEPVRQGRVIVAGSTHPGEEDLLLQQFARLRMDYPDLSMILAPRHVERVNEVCALIERHALHFVLFSELLAGRSGLAPVILVDTIGHLRNLYDYADVVFVGKSLTGRGGQNVIEPASLRKAVIVGPHVDNFRAVVEVFLQNQAMVMVQDSEELYRVLGELLGHPVRARDIGGRAFQVVTAQKGSLEKTLEVFQKFL